MATHNKYQKELQEEYPQPPRSWFPETEEEKLETGRDQLKQRKHDRGHKRWKKLPQPIDVSNLTKVNLDVLCLKANVQRKEIDD